LLFSEESIALTQDLQAGVARATTALPDGIYQTAFPREYALCSILDHLRATAAVAAQARTEGLW
jgi:hypothetical protein